MTRPLGWVAALTLCGGLAARLAPGAGAASPPSCGERSTGSRSLYQVGDQGAECMLAAYLRGCRPASYRLSSFGIDTIASDLFSLRAKGAGCEVVVEESFRVVPRPASSRTALCRALRRQGAQIVATGCVGAELTHELSLSGPR